MQGYIDAGKGSDFVVLVGSDSEILPALKISAAEYCRVQAMLLQELDVNL